MTTFLSIDEKRVEALRLATSARYSISSDNVPTVTDVIKRAEAYYTFLAGDTKKARVGITPKGARQNSQEVT